LPEPEPELPSSTDSKPEIPDPEHDPHLPPPAGLPVSVLVGLALLPFAIPLLWLVAPLLTGQPPALSLAVPISLAVAASALCLGVVYTIDWTASTRIKGVLMLLGLSYLSAAGLFFLKKDLMDRVQAWGRDPDGWKHTSVRSNDFDFEFKFRGQLGLSDVKPAPKPLPLPNMTAEGNRAAFYKNEEHPSEYRYLVGWGKAADKDFKPDDAWFARVRDHLAQSAPGAAIAELEKLGDPGRPAAGRQWTFTFTDGTIRVVRVYAVGSRVYYLSAEGPQLRPEDDDLVTPFFSSFLVHK